MRQLQPVTECHHAELPAEHALVNVTEPWAEAAVSTGGCEQRRGWEILNAVRYSWGCCCCSVAKLCLTLCDHIHGVFQARMLEWIAISTPGDLPDPGRDRTPPTCIAGRFFTIWATREVLSIAYTTLIELRVFLYWQLLQAEKDPAS